MRYFEDLSFAEIAAALATKEITLRKRVERGLALLQRHLSARGFVCGLAALPVLFSELSAEEFTGTFPASNASTTTKVEPSPANDLVKRRRASSSSHAAGCGTAVPRTRPRTWVGSMVWLLAGAMVVTAVILFIADWFRPPQKHIVSAAEGLRIRGESRLVAPQEVLAAGTMLETGMVPQNGATIDLDGRGELRLRPLTRVNLAERDGIHSLKCGVVGVWAGVGATLTVEAPRLGRLEISGLAWLSVGEHSSEVVVLEGSSLVLGRRLGASTSLVIDGQGRCIEGKLDLEQHGEVWIDRTVLASARKGQRTSPASSMMNEAALDHHSNTAGVQILQGQTKSVPMGLVGEFCSFRAEIGMNYPSDKGWIFELGSFLDLDAAIGDPDWPQFAQGISLSRGPGKAGFMSTIHLVSRMRRVGWNHSGPIHQYTMNPGGGRDAVVMFGQNDPCILTMAVTGTTTAKLISYSFSSCLGQTEPPTP